MATTPAPKKEKRMPSNIEPDYDSDWLDPFSQGLTPLIKTTLKIHPACLQFAPADISDEYPEALRVRAREHFVVGTYQLSETLKGKEIGASERPQERIGGLTFFRLKHGGAGEAEL